jgi:SOS-response transcriptional repressor LexA
MRTLKRPVEITKAQKRCYDTFRSLAARSDIPPSGDDVARALGIARQTAYGHLAVLIQKGLISKPSGKLRSMRINMRRVAAVQRERSA